MKKRSMQQVLTSMAIIPALGSIALADPGDGPIYSSPTEADSAYYDAQEHAYSQDAALMEALNDADAAQEHLQNMQATGSSSQIMSAEQNLHNAESVAGSMLSDMSGVNVDDIDAMHDGGLSWSQVGHELGINSGFGMDTSDGVGNQQHGSGMGTGISAAEMQTATARSPLSGWSESHGYGMNTGVQGGGFGAQMMGGASGLSNGYGDGAMGDGMDIGGGMGSDDRSGGTGGGGSTGGTGGGGMSGGGSAGGGGGMGGGGMH